MHTKIKLVHIIQYYIYSLNLCKAMHSMAIWENENEINVQIAAIQSLYQSFFRKGG